MWHRQHPIRTSGAIFNSKHAFTSSWVHRYYYPQDVNAVTLYLTASSVSSWSSWVARLWSRWFWQTMESVPAVPWSFRICSVWEWGIWKTFRLWLLSNQSCKGSIPSGWRRRLYLSNKMDSRIPQRRLLSNGMTWLQSWSNVVTQLLFIYRLT